MEPGSVDRYTTERSDVLLSVQLILIREAERQAAGLESAGAPGPVPARIVPASIVRDAIKPEPEPEPTAPVVAAAAVASPPPDPVVESGASSTVSLPEHDRPLPARPYLAPVPVEPLPVQVAGPSTWTGMTDTATGVPAMSALRRDLVLEQAWPAARASRPVVLVLTVERRGDLRIAPEEADHMTRAMWELAAPHLGPKDRLYRTGSGELCAILRGLDGRTTGDVASAIAPPLADMVAGRSGAWSLRTAMIEPAEAVRRLAAVHWAGDASSPEPVTGGLASAV